MKVRWIAITLFFSGGYVFGCGSESNDGFSAPCNTVCNCVAREAGESARSDCLSQCSGVRTAANPVRECRNRLAASGITSCDASCFAFGDEDPGGSGGDGNTGGSAPSSGGDTSPGGNGSPPGGVPGAGGFQASGGRPGAGGVPGAGGLQGSGGRLGTGGGPGAGNVIGRACARDIDCGGSAVCLTSTSTTLGGGGPPNGYCAVDCSADVNACAAVDPNAVCVRFATGASAPAFCLEGCTVGRQVQPPVKCHDRPDVACDDTGAPSPGEGFCRPTCRNDADCGVRRCDLASGFCVSEPLPAGALAIGSPCDPSAATEQCAGVCLALTEETNGPGMCAGLCTLGAVGCGAPSSGGAPPGAACLFPLTEAEPDVGDLGICGKLCNCDDECPAYQRVCRPFSPADADAAGFLGYCGGAVDANGNPTEHLACN